jgi:uncharacterized protein
MTRSAIYEGTIRHRRFTDASNEFSYGLSLVYVDLDELPGLLGGRLATARPGLVRFRRRDYLGDRATPLPEAVREEVRRQTGSAPGGPVRLLTQLRSFGHCFNPVSFYYLFEEDGESLGAVLAEVTNTPWGERHAYVLRREDGGPVVRGQSEKAMHVSPFMGMDQRYSWSVATPGHTLSVHIESREAGAKAFDATLALQRRELSRRSLADVTARYPLAAMRVLALIYAHAARLKLKGVPVHPHPQGTA